MVDSVGGLLTWPYTRRGNDDSPAWRYRFGDVRLAMFVVIASLHAPLDTRVARLRVAFPVPAGAATENWFRAAARSVRGCGHCRSCVRCPN